MPVIDKIRARVREKDCLFAVFGDANGKVFSPMNGQISPVPGTASTGVEDVDNGLLELSGCTAGNGSFQFPYLANRYVNKVKSKLCLWGERPGHTAIMKIRIDYDLDADDSQVYNYEVGMGQTLSVRADNPFCLYWRISNQYGWHNIGANICCQSPSEYEEGGSTSGVANYGVYKTYEKSELVNRWMVIAATWDQDTRQIRVYRDGVCIASGTQSNWTSDRTMFSHANSSFPVLTMGNQTSGSTFATMAHIQWAALFNTVMNDDEIKNLSEV